MPLILSKSLSAVVPLNIKSFHSSILSLLLPYHSSSSPVVLYSGNYRRGRLFRFFSPPLLLFLPSSTLLEITPHLVSPLFPPVVIHVPLFFSHFIFTLLSLYLLLVLEITEDSFLGSSSPQLFFFFFFFKPSPPFVPLIYKEKRFFCLFPPLLIFHLLLIRTSLVSCSVSLRVLIVYVISLPIFSFFLF